jgi:hypothetical protein
MRRIRLFSLWALLDVSCVKYANEYAPDRARNPDVFGDTKGLLAYVSMQEGASLKHFAGGVDLRAFDGEKRKAAPLASFRFAPEASGAWIFRVRYESPEAQQVKVRVNGLAVGGFLASGSASWSAAVPAAALVKDTATLVEIESERGLGLFELGFVRP